MTLIVCIQAGCVVLVCFGHFDVLWGRFTRVWPSAVGVAETAIFVWQRSRGRALCLHRRTRPHYFYGFWYTAVDLFGLWGRVGPFSLRQPLYGWARQKLSTCVFRYRLEATRAARVLQHSKKGCAEKLALPVYRIIVDIDDDR